jgi:hypothetical protein
MVMGDSVTEAGKFKIQSNLTGLKAVVGGKSRRLYHHA